MTMKSKTKLDETKAWLKSEIKKRKDILSDEFLKVNMYPMELGQYALELDIYKKVLRRLK
jgi:hypothetical protein